MTTGRILGASIGDCVHVAGLLRFLGLAEQSGYDTDFLGPAVSIADLVAAAVESDPDMIAISYRLSPEAGKRILTELKHAVTEAGLTGKRFAFGGTSPVCEQAKEVGLFEAVFDGHAMPDQIISYLRGDRMAGDTAVLPDKLVPRIAAKKPYPLIRHHFGLPSLPETLRGIEQIAESGVLDIISLGPDQNAQACFFRPEEMDPAQDGAGGVPIRSEEDLDGIKEASLRGNRPLVRCYSGTRDLLRMAEVLQRTIDNAWCAVPLCWYNVLDGRSNRPVAEAIRENQRVMAWHGERGVPVEVNEAHHWSLRDAHDVIAVVMAYVAAYNAKKMGVGDYVAQFMFNTPAGTWVTADIGKMLAKLDLLERLAGPEFRVWRQTRAGLASYPADLDVAKGQLASSVFVQQVLKPHIVHVVGFSEADHAATADDVVESCKIARGVIDNCLQGTVDLSLDACVQERRRELVAEAEVLIDAIVTSASGVDDPLVDADVLAGAIYSGLLDAPHLRGNKAAAGRLMTRMIDGAAVAIGGDGKKIGERERIELLRGMG